MRARKITLLQCLLPLCTLFLQVPAQANTLSSKKSTEKHIEAGFTQQPTSQTACNGSSVQFKVTYSDATVLSYQWQKNGNALLNDGNISGANTSILTINPTGENDNAAYTCVVTHSTGIATSEEAWLNNRIESVSGATTCLNTTASVSVVAEGNAPGYQWYRANGNSNNGGSIIQGANLATYTPDTDSEGTTYYYVVVTSNGEACTAVTSSTVAFTVIGSVSAGQVSENTAVCPGTEGTVSISGYNGVAIQWQQSANGLYDWSDVTEGTGGTTDTYTTPGLNQIMYYRAVVNGAFCGTDTSGIVSVTPTYTYVWTGAVNGNWHVAENWSCGVVPTTINDVIIPSATIYKPVVAEGQADAKSIIVQSGTSVTVETGATLHLVNIILVEEGGKMTVNNNAALVQDNNTANNGEVTVLRDSNPLFRLDYTLWSSPVSGQKLQDFSPATASNRYYEYKYANGTNGWVEGYWAVDPTSNFNAGKGYLIRMPNGDATTGYNEGTSAITYNGTFKGTPLNGTIEVPLSTQNNRFTAVGNPYASPINLEAFFGANNGKLENGTGIYLWRKKNNAEISSYVTVTLAAFTANAGTVTATGDEPEDAYAYGGQDQAGYFAGNYSNWTLSQGQGFIVKTAENAPSTLLTFTNDMRRPAPQSGGQAFFRQAQSTASRLWVNLTNTTGGFSQAAVAYMDNTTTGIDYGYDGKSIADASSIAVYTVAANNNLSIQARPGFTLNDTVQLGYNAVTAGTYTLKLDRRDGVFAQGQKIYLKDNIQGITRELSENAYSFTTDAGVFNNRFEVLYTTTEALSIDANNFSANEVIIYNDSNGINIVSDTAEISQITVYDISGRQLYTNGSINDIKTVIAGLTVKQQVVIVEVNTIKGKATKKVLL
ncbi:immunoglobulin domain-containing protein [Flavobacterium psychrotrophum]|uniref:immunoglobulin domain-containing protein n=1 Tax=Flavobacterium psychrotrophum TaxID=2294119 RepID=UPI000E30C136|nr:immunoglobulin domain-containing protein [Flavobacterium psychrotrophum]